MIAELARALAEATLATSIAIIAVLAVRRPLMARLGASVTYAAWALVPVAALAVLLPAPERLADHAMALIESTAATAPQGDAPPARGVNALQVLMLAWALGTFGMLAVLWRQQHLFHKAIRVAPASTGLPAVIGLLRPRIVLPADFDTRYDDVERELILCHERVHVRRLDLQVNAFAAALRVLFWFNPLVHLAAGRFRRDQELACDERVVARHPGLRRRYADAMLKTHIATSPLPIGCHWQDATPLKERIAMLKIHAPGARRSIIGAALLAMLAFSGGYAAWAAQPARDAESAKPGFLVLITFDVNGETRRFEIREAADTPFSFTTEIAGNRYKGTLTVKDMGGNQVRIDATLARNDEIRMRPSMLSVLGKPASMEEGSPGDYTRMTVIATRWPSDQQAAPSVSMPPELSQGNLNPFEGPSRQTNGKVVVSVGIDSDGSILDLDVVESEPAGVFDDAARDLVRKMKFTPAIENGMPVPRTIRVPLRFDHAPPPPPPPLPAPLPPAMN